MLLDESTGSTFDAISGQTLREHLIVLAPSAEQLRIVAEIEKQFTRLDAGLAGLKRVQANLKRYRAAVLKAACEGRLVPTEAELARREGRCYEPASILLDRILAERRSGWEAAQLAKSKSVGKLFQDESWKQLYRQPSPPNTSGFEELPEGWTRASIGQVADCLDGRRVPINKQERTKRGGNIPYYGANGPVGTIDDYLFDEPLVLVVEDETFVGRTLPFSYLIKGPSWVNNHAHVLRATSAVLPEFLNYSLMFYPFTPLTTGSTGRRKLTQKALMSAPYPLPPLAEQTRIVAEIERLLSTVDKTMEAAGSTLGRSNTMRHGILRSAFEGKLVLQDPNDEPASVLLERIRSTGTLGRVSSDRKIRATAQFAHASRKK
jgi:type I restriction enzyme S subunit